MTPDSKDLLIAACQNDIAQMRALLDAGVDPNAVDPEIGHSALYNATRTDHVDAIRTLVRMGADPNLRLNYRSPIDRRKECGVVALMYAISLDAAKSLVEGGAAINVADDSGVTSLIRAAHRGKEDIVRFLLDAGADPRRKTRGGLSASDVVQSQIAKYESWVQGGDRTPIADKVERLTRIHKMLTEG